MEPRSTRPKSSPRATSEQMIELVLQTREHLKTQGWDYGPLSAPSPPTYREATRTASANETLRYRNTR